MKSRWIAVVAALFLPALAWAATNTSLRCRLPCGDNCPLPCPDCPLDKR